MMTMSLSNDETNWTYGLAFTCVILPAIILVLQFGMLGYIKDLLFRRDANKRNIDEEWRPYLKTILTDQAIRKIRIHLGTISGRLLCDEIKGDLIANYVLPFDSERYQQYEALQTDNKRVHFLLLHVLSKGTYRDLKVFVDAIIRSDQEALIPYLPGLDEEELKLVKQRVFIIETDADLIPSQDAVIKVKNVIEKELQQVRGIYEDISQQITQNVEDFKMKLKETRSKSESSVAKIEQRHQRDREQIMDKMQEMLSKVEGIQADLKERMDDIEIQTTENYDNFKEADENYEQMRLTLTEMIDASNAMEEQFNSTLEDLKEEFDKTLQTSLEELQELFQQRFLDFTQVYDDHAKHWQLLENRMNASVNTLQSVNRIKNEITIIEDTIKCMEDTGFQRDEDISLLRQHTERLDSQVKDNEEVIRSQFDVISRLNKCYQTLGDKVNLYTDTIKGLSELEVFAVRMDTPDLLVKEKPVFFDCIVLDSKHFNLLNSSYTCPFSGIYEFNSAITLHKGSATASLQINNNTIMELVMDASYRNKDQSSDGIIVRCKQYEKVQIVLTDCTDDAALYINENGKAIGCAWSGKLLFLSD